MSLTADQVQIIRSTVPVLQQHGNDITTLFYRTMIDENPELRNIFNQANQFNNHQPRALAGALYAYASHIDDVGALAPAVEKICQRHASLYVRPEQYEIVGKYLLRAMGDVLGSALTPEVLEAWAKAYGQLANLMIGREEQLYEESEGWSDWRDFKIVDKVKESDVITSFYFKPVDGKPLPLYKPGQYTAVLVDVAKLGYKQPRQYSLSDAPNHDYYRVSIKKEDGLDTGDPMAEAHPGYVSNVMHQEKKVGDVVKLAHPVGDFFLDPEKDDDCPVVLLSAGVGITPMVSILNTLVERSSKQRISFINGARNTAVQAFGSHVSEIATLHPNIKATYFIKQPSADTDGERKYTLHSGRVSLDALDQVRDLCLDDKKTVYFICGPAAFMTGMQQGLKSLGVKDGMIRMELFGTGEITTS
ncbi:flavohemo protein [Hortaea werneckii]|nr:flavohemo protein [Hortaea werneckii]